jgi:hypothetical protein
MLQDMDGMEASCIFHVTVELEQSKICILTVIKEGTGILTMQDDLIDCVRFIKYYRDCLKVTLSDLLSLE